MAVTLSSIKGLLKNANENIFRRIQELILLDPYHLGNHKLPNEDEINDILNLSLKYDTMILDILNEKSTTPTCFILEQENISNE